MISSSSKTVLSVFGLAPTRIGGAESFARELSSQLGRLGYSSVLCFESAPPPLVHSYLAIPNVTLGVVEGTSHGSDMMKLAGVIKKYKPEVVHFHFTPFLSLYYWAAKLCGARRIYFTDHSSPAADLTITRQSLWKRLAARLLTNPLTQATTVSEFGHDCFLRRDLVSSKKVSMIYNSVDFSRVENSETAGAQFRQKYRIPSDRKLVLQVSWMIPEKGVQDLLRAMQIVLRQEPDVQLALVGEGRCQGEFEALAQQLDIAEHVTFTGKVHDPMAEGVYAAADVVCQLSRWQEVFGYVIAEAMAFGKPIVGSDTGGVPELVENGVTGFLVPPGDYHAAAEKILNLLADCSSRQGMGAAGLHAAQQKFDLQINVAQLIHLYGMGAASAQA